MDRDVESLALGVFNKVFSDKLTGYFDSLLHTAVEYYLFADKNKKTSAQVEDDIKNNKELFTAFALFSSVSFDRQELCDGNLQDLDQDSAEYLNRLASNIRKSVIKNLDLKN